jgi:epoxyqueuosine reductase
VNSSALARRVKDRALELGFDRAGVSDARRSARAEAFEAWLARGYHEGMDYLARDPDRRADPRVRDPWAKSVVSVAWNYATAPRETAGLLAGVARYAAGEDYHEVLAARLEQLASFVRDEAPGTRTRVAVDTSAMLERDAAAAGLGWNAKNTMLIDETLGSWTLLGEIVTEAELQPDRPVADRCGSCRACLDACPTGAILEEGLLDARRCISTWTIELRGRIPAADRAAVGDHLFGCDICQDVCPWNRSVPSSADPAARPLPGLAETTLAEAAALTEDAFRALFARSSIRRTKRRGLVRNALIVGANTGGAGVLEAAPGLLADPDPVVRGAAAWAIGRGEGARAPARLEGALGAETDPDVIEELRAALEGRDQPRSSSAGATEASGSPTSNSSPARRTG